MIKSIKKIRFVNNIKKLIFDRGYAKSMKKYILVDGRSSFRISGGDEAYKQVFLFRTKVEVKRFLANSVAREDRDELYLFKFIEY